MSVRKPPCNVLQVRKKRVLHHFWCGCNAVSATHKCEPRLNKTLNKQIQIIEKYISYNTKHNIYKMVKTHHQMVNNCILISEIFRQLEFWMPGSSALQLHGCAENTLAAGK